MKIENNNFLILFFALCIGRAGSLFCSENAAAPQFSAAQGVSLYSSVGQVSLTTGAASASSGSTSSTSTTSTAAQAQSGEEFPLWALGPILGGLAIGALIGGSFGIKKFLNRSESENKIPPATASQTSTSALNGSDSPSTAPPGRVPRLSEVEEKKEKPKAAEQEKRTPEEESARKQKIEALVRDGYSLEQAETMLKDFLETEKMPTKPAKPAPRLGGSAASIGGASAVVGNIASEILKNQAKNSLPASPPGSPAATTPSAEAPKPVKPPAAAADSTQPPPSPAPAATPPPPARGDSISQQQPGAAEPSRPVEITLPSSPAATPRPPEPATVAGEPAPEQTRPAEPPEPPATTPSAEPPKPAEPPAATSAAEDNQKKADFSENRPRYQERARVVSQPPSTMGMRVKLVGEDQEKSRLTAELAQAKQRADEADTRANAAELKTQIAEEQAGRANLQSLQASAFSQIMQDAANESVNLAQKAKAAEAQRVEADEKAKAELAAAQQQAAAAEQARNEAEAKRVEAEQKARTAELNLKRQAVQQDDEQPDKKKQQTPAVLKTSLARSVKPNSLLEQEPPAPSPRPPELPGADTPLPTSPRPPAQAAPLPESPQSSLRSRVPSGPAAVKPLDFSRLLTDAAQNPLPSSARGAVLATALPDSPGRTSPRSDSASSVDSMSDLPPVAPLPSPSTQTHRTVEGPLESTPGPLESVASLAEPGSPPGARASGVSRVTVSVPVGLGAPQGPRSSPQWPAPNQPPPVPAEIPRSAVPVQTPQSPTRRPGGVTFQTPPTRSQGEASWIADALAVNATISPGVSLPSHLGGGNQGGSSPSPFSRPQTAGPSRDGGYTTVRFRSNTPGRLG